MKEKEISSTDKYKRRSKIAPHQLLIGCHIIEYLTCLDGSMGLK